MTNLHLQVLQAQAVLTVAPCLLQAPAVALVVAVSRRTVDVGDPGDEVGRREPGLIRQVADQALPLRGGVKVTPGRILDHFLEASLNLLPEDGDHRPNPLVILEIEGYPEAGTAAAPGQKTHTMANDAPNDEVCVSVDFRHE
jgi:hypothetical protein